MEWKYYKYRRITKFIGLILLCCIILWAASLLYNNISLQNNKDFSASLDKSIRQAVVWISKGEGAILKSPNIPLLKMLDECDKMHPTAEFLGIIKKLMSKQTRPRCWKALIDPNWPIDQKELYETANNENIDNKWILYAISRGNFNATAEQLGLLDGSRWKGRLLTHQLWALIHLRERTKTDDKIENLINYLTDRLEKELTFNTAVVDIYIQKASFVLRAGYPEKVRRRWIERIIENQHNDGGWNDKWFCFGSRWRSSLRLYKHKPTDSHATIQALWLLYQVKYCYPEYFGLIREDGKQADSPEIKAK
jgi:hypothetical protein